MKHLTAATGLALAAILAGCASPDYRAPAGQPVMPAQAYPAGTYPGTAQTPYMVAYGTVETIQQVGAQGAGGVPWGTVAGGVVGGLLGSQVGSGTGKTAATVAGAVGGAALGSSANAQGRPMYQIGIRLDNGSFVTVNQDTVAGLQVGTRVGIDSNNRVYRY